MNKKLNIVNPVNFFVGILASIILVFFLGSFLSSDGIGSIEFFVQFVYFSVVCTAGISLILWIPTFSLLGAIVTGTTGLFFNKKFNLLLDNTSDKTIIKESNNELALIGYIVNSRNTGITNDMTIRLNLKKSGGWSDTEIDKAFEKCGPKL
ncbi:MAG: hypothetical protein PHN69_01625 [Candidatus Pacebacteria bacterium]|nr:hypothetical protein [Candidatus Paceibacterota bacterium]